MEYENVLIISPSFNYFENCKTEGKSTLHVVMKSQFYIFGKRLLTTPYRVYQNSMQKLQQWIP
jgi:hypothetical protein